MIAVEQCLILDCTEVSTALFLLLATHYVFNLSYQGKALMFIQEKVAKIASDKHTKRRPVGDIHVTEINSIYERLKETVD